MIWVVVVLATTWALVGMVVWYMTTPSPRSDHLKRSLGYAARLSLLITFYVAVELALGFVILVFHTNPSPPTLERAATVEYWKYFAFGLASFLIGMACYRSVQGSTAEIDK